jgi:hypothetical protein
MGDRNTRLQFGPVYLDELQSLEFRSLSSGARDLWTVLTARTRSLRFGPSSAKGWKCSVEHLAADIGRPDGKGGPLKPVSTRTVKRYIRELKDAGLLHVAWTRGWSTFSLLRPPSLREPGSVAVPEMCQKSSQDGTRLGVPSTSKNKQLPNYFSGEEGTPIENPVEKLARYMEVANTVQGLRLPERFAEVGCSTWDEAARAVPQVLRGTFSAYRPTGTSDREFDDIIRKAGESFVREEPQAVAPEPQPVVPLELQTGS